MTETLRRVTVTAVTGLGLCLTLLPAGQAQAQARAQQAPTRVPCNDIAALKTAINDANTGGGSIVLAPRCVYNLSQTDNPDDGLPEITGNVRISGEDTYIQRGTNSQAPFRIFHVTEGGSLSVDSVTVRGGQTTAASGHGGGFFNDRGRLTLTDVTVSNNQGSVGGGIWNQRGTLRLDESTVRDNKGGFGAGVATNGTMRMWGGAIRDNQGQIWGGGLANAGDTRLNHVRVDGNTSGDHGGGIMTMAINSQTGPLRVNSTRVRENIAQTDGGGIQTGADEPTTLYRSSVNHNTSNGGPNTGGGIANPGTRFSLFIGTNSTVKRKTSKGDSTKKQPTPFEVNLIRSTVFKNFPTNCAPPGSVPRCDAVGSAPASKAPERPSS